MTFVRKAALKISDAVLRWASPGCKEWAEGLEREAEFIEGDWAALGWAIGSLRVALDRRQARVGTGFVPRSPGFGEWMFWITTSSQIFTSGFLAIKGAPGWERTGWILVGSGWIYWMTSSVSSWLEERNAPPSYDSVASVMFGRAKLERRLERYRSVRRWMPMLATASICTGLVLIVENGTGWGHIFTGFVVSGGAFAEWMQSLDSPEKIERRIALVDERIAKQSEAGGL